MTMWPKTILQDLTQPKYQAIADAIELYISDGKLKPDDKLPSQRGLARHLKITIGTVGRGYALAESKGLVRSTVGRGCVVCGVDDSESTSRDLAIDLGQNTPPRIANERLLTASLNQIVNRRDAANLLASAPVQTTLQDQKAAAAWLNRRVDCELDQIQICTGTQSALAAVLLTTTMPGDSILVEEYCFPGMLSIANTLSRKLVPLQMDEEGILPSSLEQMAEHGQAIYCTPTNQNPTTATMSLPRRKAIARLINKKQLVLIEDDVYGLTIDHAPPPISTLVPEQSYLVMSLAKTLSIGLRLAYLKVPSASASQIKSASSALSFFPPPLLVELCSKWILDGAADQILVERIAESKSRLEIARKELTGFAYFESVGGNHIWLTLPEEWNPSTFEKAAAANNVIVYPSSEFAVTQSTATKAIRIALGNARTKSELATGLRVLRKLMDKPVANSVARY